MISQIQFHMGFFSAVSFASILVVILSILPVQGEVLIYNEIDFRGTVQKFTSIVNCTNLDLTNGTVLSLKTFRCLFVYDEYNCFALMSRENPSFSVKIPPGNYPDFSKFLKDSHFPCGVKSIQSCDKVVPVGQKPSLALYHNILSTNLILFNLVEMEDVCGCVNLPVATYEQVRQLWSMHCFTLFNERNCQGKSVQVAGGHNAAAMDLRVAAFNGATKSLSVCEDVHACGGANETVAGYSLNEFGYPVPFTNSEIFPETSLQTSQLVTNPDTVSRSVCTDNYTCFTSCGGVLHSEKGAIHYKLKESLEAFERCVWIVRAPANRSKFDVNVVWTGFKPTVGRAEILISGILTNPIEHEHSYYGHHLGGELGVYWKHFFNKRAKATPQHIDFEGPLMIVTFYTEEILDSYRNSTGFIIEYSTARASEEYYVSPFSSDITINFGENLSYPSSQPRTYSSFELSTFLLQPGSGVLQMGTKRFGFDINAQTLDLGPNGDRIYVLDFTQQHNWFYWTTNVGYIIKDKNSNFFDMGDYVRRYDDMVLVILMSNSNTPGHGFSLTSEVMERKVCE